MEAPEAEAKSVRALAGYLTDGLTSDEEKIRAIYRSLDDGAHPVRPGGISGVRLRRPHTIKGKRRHLAV